MNSPPKPTKPRTSREVASGVSTVLVGLACLAYAARAGPFALLPPLPLFGPLIPTIAAAVLLWRGGSLIFGDARLTLTLRNATLSFAQPNYPIGGTVDAVLRLEPDRPLRVRGATLVVRTVSRIRYQSGTGDFGGPRFQLTTLAQKELPLKLPREIASRLEQPVSFELPANIPPSWCGHHHAFITSAEVRLDLEDVPVQVMKQDIEVRAELAR